MAELNILIVGHACRPESGSELGVTWNWAWHLAAKHRVWVITHGHFSPRIVEYMRANPRPNLRFIWVGPLGWWDPWNGIVSRGIRLHYVLWQRAVVKAARRLMESEPIDIVHHVSWNTLSAPPLLWRTGKPFVWGPIGGGQTLPWRFLSSFGRGAAAELLRTLRVGLMPWTPRLRRTVARADLMLAANNETAKVLRKAGARNIPMLPDVGIQPLYLGPSHERGTGPTLTVLWAGRLEPFKAVKICLDVAKAIPSRSVHFLIAGYGSQEAWADQYAARLNLHDRVTFLRRLSWPDLQQRFAEADLFLFTSVRDTLGAVVFEAVAQGCPVICLNHNGAATHLPDAAAIKVRVTDPQMVVQEMASQIEGLLSDRQRLRHMSDAAYRFAETQRWDSRAILMEQLYRQVLAQRAAKEAGAAVVATGYAPTLERDHYPVGYHHD